MYSMLWCPLVANINLLEMSSGGYFEVRLVTICKDKGIIVSEMPLYLCHMATVTVKKSKVIF